MDRQKRDMIGVFVLMPLLFLSAGAWFGYEKGKRAGWRQAEFDYNEGMRVGWRQAEELQEKRELLVPRRLACAPDEAESCSCVPGMEFTPAEPGR